ncbi:MAG: glycoside hydrolase family 3 protein [Ruminococcaceae bacterium]|nr:glycoside hydrolase family 3 protein [Oscillospiraceae bacterium]
MKSFRRITAMILAAVLVLSALYGCGSTEKTYPAVQTTDVSQAEQIVASLTLEQKAAQMVQAQYDAINFSGISKYPVGSVLSGGGDFSNSSWSASVWSDMIDTYQKYVIGSSGVPIIYGIDAVHGVGKMSGAVVFPHNIGIGAANDPELTRQMGQAVANEMKLSGILLNFAPCVAISEDPRWGRTYECYSSDTAIVTSLGRSFAEGLLEEGVMPCAKHFIGDGSTEYGTAYASNGTPLDRGDSQVNMDYLRANLLPPYEALIESGVKVIMPSHGSVNGVRMHENKELLTDLLKGELGFDGFVISDWESVNELSGDSLRENVILAINAGVDMLMQPYNYGEVIGIIVDAVSSGEISMERIDDAVTRIIRVKIGMGVMADPYLDNDAVEVTRIGSDGYRELAQELVKKSMVLLKNEDDVLPFKQGTKVLALGQALDDVGVLCGGWTGSWCGDTDKNTDNYLPGTTILDGLREYHEAGIIELITDESRIDEADVVLIGLGEEPYAEWYGDSDDISVTGNNALEDNSGLIRLAKDSGKPTVALIVAGRNVLISDQIGNWDAVVQCYLPGNEAGAAAEVLCGEQDFSGRLPMPWYAKNSDIDSDAPDYLFDLGYGLSYNG